MTILKPGCIIDTPDHGHAVCVGIEPDYVQYRYFATRVADHAPIWVLNGCWKADATWVSEGNTISQLVVNLIGPYGEGDLE